MVNSDCSLILFDDGIPPWSGRRAADAYLARLRVLHRYISVN